MKPRTALAVTGAGAVFAGVLAINVINQRMTPTAPQPVVSARRRAVAVSGPVAHLPNVRMQIRFVDAPHRSSTVTFELRDGSGKVLYMKRRRTKRDLSADLWTVVVPREVFYAEMVPRLILDGTRQNGAAYEITLPQGFTGTSDPAGVE